MQDDSIEHTIKQYIAAGAAEGAIAAAQKVSKAIGVELDQILATVRSSVEPVPALAGGRSLTVAAGLATAHGSALDATMISRDYATVTEGLTVIRQVDVDEATRQASRGGLAALNANQWIIVAAVLIAAVFSMLPHNLRERLLDDINLVAAIANVLELMKH